VSADALRLLALEALLFRFRLLPAVHTCQRPAAALRSASAKPTRRQ
jgi:hypothetical protein